MKLRDLEVFVVGNLPPGFGGRYFIFTKLTTDNGIVGYGECYAATVGPATMVHVIEDVFARHMLGQSPENIELMFRKVYSSGFSQRPDPTVIGAFSGLEIACWDILGKARERPVHALLGGRIHQRLRAYTYLYPKDGQDPAAFYGSASMSAEAAVHLVETHGFTALKFDPAGPYTIMGGHQPTPRDLSRAAEFCRTLRAAVGDRADLAFGTHGQFTAAGAIRMAHAIAPYQPLWFEEPVPPDDAAAMATVAARSPVPIATGERLSTTRDFAPLLAARAVGIVQPALGRLGGIWEGRKLAVLAENASAQVAPHLYAGPLEWAANLQLAASLPNFLIAETILTGGGFHAELLRGSIGYQNGYLYLPDAPGLGVELNEEVARANPYTGDRLHLEMSTRPHGPDSEDWAGG